MKAGIYIHIPFCKTKCSYCNFYSSASIKHIEEMVACICKELILRKDYLLDKTISTIYLGGGTPSLLRENHVEEIFQTLRSHYHVDTEAEITIEANPDDITPALAASWINSGINRLSIGVQSFEDSDLKYLNRRHDGFKSQNAILIAQEAGFSNISIDLIFGVPNQTDQSIIEFITRAKSLNIPHISAYALTLEQNTALDNHVNRGIVQAPSEEQMASQFLLVSDSLKDNNYTQYEISNFSIPGFHSRHNSNYWNGTPYLGIGPSAHSYNGKSRQWNVANTTKYMKSLIENEIPCEVEELTDLQRYNEYVMTSLRTSKGLDMDYLKANFDSKIYAEFLTLITKPLADKSLYADGIFLKLSREGILFADRISSNLFITE